MNDNDIIKALECCTVSSSIETCGECPYAECPTRKGCVGEMVKDALDIINCLKIENAELQLKKSEMEIELQAMRGAANSYKAEVERLMPFGCQVEVSKNIEKEIKSEAIKEFAERLKEEATVDDDSIWWIAGVDIDKVLKEMVGDTE